MQITSRLSMVVVGVVMVAVFPDGMNAFNVPSTTSYRPCRFVEYNTKLQSQKQHSQQHWNKHKKSFSSAPFTTFQQATSTSSLSASQLDDDDAVHEENINNAISDIHYPLLSSRSISVGVTTMLSTLVLWSSAELPAYAAGAYIVGTGPVANALVAYSHYFLLLTTTILLMYERLTVKEGMDSELEKTLTIADSLYGINGLLLLGSGYLRLTDYGKGWDYYSHEPFFWIKMSALSLLAGLSAFPTITFVKRGVPIFQGQTIPPLSSKLANRLKQVINAEISAVLSIPLFASLMARGVWYSEDFPWQAGAALVAVVLFGSGFVYGKQALQWTETDTEQQIVE